ncbi:MAG: hypothetical protein NXI22_06195 [bacterium]|nr:hypothetical protein [bacterium]
MSDSTVVKELPETSYWYGAISEEDVKLVRKRHAEKVEEWLDEASFCAELFQLHKKYGIDDGEEGYVAYRRHLRTNYYEKLYTYGPTPDPLDEGCDCIFCNIYGEEPPAEVRCEVAEETVVHSTSSGECELPEATSKPQGTGVPRSLVVNQKKSAARRRFGNDQPGETADSAYKKFTSVAKSYNQATSGDVERCDDRLRRKKIVRPDRVDEKTAKKRARTKRKTGAIF